ncbi:protein PROTON GRADIENT REGULATION 5, chloroplastic [Senna tora]|uniref:Protein PROTON GRADIENT REGULATION 5, chloroplastic n=1 Tax=Senna tora TaxID=362788 RepID=A0A834T140_9FABA|nr:protein PROTON GRADIENT REGULATION 5, chloroplastic [Senna tora]
MATSSICVGSSFYGSWGTSSMVGGEDYNRMLAKTVSSRVDIINGGKSVRFEPMMKNVNEGKGLFAPLVVVTRNVVGKKRFNQIRGKAIALHSQRQGLIRLAKKNGERLGFLA